MGFLCAAAFAAYAGVTGLGFIVALEAADEFGVGTEARGVLLAGFGIAGMLAGRAAGDAVDRFGRVTVAAAGALASGLLVALLGAAPGPAVLGALWFAAGIGSTLYWAAVNTLAVEAVPRNRAGGTSVVSAFKFAGAAAAPLLWLPLYHVAPELAFLAAGAAAAAAGALVLPLRARAEA
jgi:MFS family permease